MSRSGFGEGKLERRSQASEPANYSSIEIAWRGQVSQEFAPKNVTDIYVRMYEPVGVTDSYSPGTYVPGTVISDIVTPGEETTDPAEYLAQSFTGVRILPNPTVAEVQQITFGSAINSAKKRGTGAERTSSRALNWARSCGRSA